MNHQHVLPPPCQPEMLLCKSPQARIVVKKDRHPENLSQFQVQLLLSREIGFIDVFLLIDQPR